MQLIMFSKMLGKLSVADAAKTIKSLGFQGVDLTVRPGGHLLPENVRRDLPVAVQAIHAAGLEMPMLTTGVVDASAPYSEDIFATAASCGAKYLKLGYWRYQKFGTLRAEMDTCRRALAGIAKLAAKHEVVAGLHIHSNSFLSEGKSSALDLHTTEQIVEQ
ncbi:MAG: sugar phosphate isomerase/epimerase, partial [Verrucomicrobia bacterium]|nr:sugar phosphate isomerase/epimerase [Verrucomicrobiota bacterium]